MFYENLEFCESLGGALLLKPLYHDSDCDICFTRSQLLAVIWTESELFRSLRHVILTLSRSPCLQAGCGLGAVKLLSVPVWL